MTGRRGDAWLGLVVGLAAHGPVRAEPVRPALATTRAEPAPSRGERRDPFRPPRLGAGTTASLGEVRTPLERYEIGQLRLVAVIYGSTQPRAVVEDDQGLGYIVKPGTRIGPNGGEVASIDRGRLVVRETSVDFYGESRPLETVLEMKTVEPKPGKSDGRGRP